MFAVLCASLTSLRAEEAAPAQLDETFFETRIRPILAGTCVECHGPEVANGGLRLDTRDALITGGERGPAVILGDAESSLLIRALRHDDESLQMPPDEPLPAEVVSDLKAWIAAGAPWPAAVSAPLISEKSHWAFMPLQKATPPRDPTGWATEPLDQWIAAARAKHGLRPNPPADKGVLVRRAYYDLLGLPPTPEQIEAFLADERPDAFARLVDELLASPHYGERWGRYWLDLVRYADTAGDNSDYPIPQAHLYRDYVIDALNADVPYDRFLHEQLAGDLLAQQAPPNDFARLVIATGFIAQAKRMGTRELEDMHIVIEDTLATVGPAILGLSLRCARCHDHKFDPLSQKDYYALYGFFASTQYPFPGAEEVRKQTHFVPLISPDDQRRRKTEHDQTLTLVKEQIKQLEEQTLTLAAPASAQDLAATSDESPMCDDATARKQVQEKLESLRAEQKRLESLDPLAGVPTAYAVMDLKPIDVPIHLAGDPRKAGDIVPRGVPRVLDSARLAIPEGVSGRLELARWMTTKASFLTARVMANRLWQYHFGKPLAATPSDFGYRGASPTHPELLDWLASELVDSGWSLKAMHRRIMLSQTYQLSSDQDLSNSERDTGNSWYWRFDRRRLDAEALRDTLLLLGGSLDLTRPGPHPFPEPSTWKFTAHHQFNHASYPSNHRSVYLMVQRLHAHPYLSLFNGADPSLSTAMRDNSTVPLQSLFLLNNELVHQWSTRFAQRLEVHEPDATARIHRAFLLAYGRSPSEAEVARTQEFLERYEQTMAQEGVAGERRTQEAWSALARTMMASNELTYID
jgi:hypothetical protein